jgi:hypothetical protein
MEGQAGIGKPLSFSYLVWRWGLLFLRTGRRSQTERADFVHRMAFRSVSVHWVAFMVCGGGIWQASSRVRLDGLGWAVGGLESALYCIRI